MDSTIAMISTLWPIFAPIVVGTIVGIIRVEALNWRVKSLEKSREEGEREMYTLRLEVQNINTQIVKELNQIRESLSWIKGRFARSESPTTYNQTHYHEDK